MSQEMILDPNLWKDIPDDILFDLKNALADTNMLDSNSSNFWEELPPLNTSTKMNRIPSWTLRISQELRVMPSLDNTQANLDTQEPEISNANRNSSQKTIETRSFTQEAKEGPKTRSKKRKGAPSSKESEANNKEEKMEEAASPEILRVTVTDAIIASKPEEEQLTEVIKDLHKILKSQEKLLDEIHTRIAKLNTKQLNEFTGVQQQLFSLQQQLKTESKEVSELQKKWLLSTEQLVEIVQITSEINQQQKRSDVYVTELQHLASESDKSVVSLVIVDQPPAQVVFKGRPLDGSFEVKLITGAQVDDVKVSDVFTSVKSEDETWKNTKNAIQNATAKFDKHNVAILQNIKLNVSSRMNAIYLNFGVTVQTDSDEFSVKSEETNAVIVITNESQWGEAATRIFHAEAYREVGEIPWILYANHLHRFVLHSSALELKANSKKNTQEVDHNGRGLKDWELSYVHTKIFNQKMRVTENESKKYFWNWFGSVLTTIRFKRHIRNLWLKGYIYGLIAKKDCQRILRSEAPGSFIIRFSDSAPGSFAVAYSTDDPEERVKHYLVKPEDISANKALPDFLRDKEHFKELVYVDLPTGKIVKTPKDTVFKDYYSARKQNLNQLDRLGYVQNL